MIFPENAGCSGNTGSGVTGTTGAGGNANFVSYRSFTVIPSSGAPQPEYPGQGNGVIDALVHALAGLCPGLEIVSYDEHALGEGSDAKAVAYIGLKNETGKLRYGVGVDSDIVVASARALICAINRLQ